MWLLDRPHGKPLTEFKLIAAACAYPHRRPSLCLLCLYVCFHPFRQLHYTMLYYVYYITLYDSNICKYYSYYSILYTLTSHVLLPHTMPEEMAFRLPSLEVFYNKRREGARRNGVVCGTGTSPTPGEPRRLGAPWTGPLAFSPLWLHFLLACASVRVRWCGAQAAPAPCASVRVRRAATPASCASVRVRRASHTRSLCLRTGAARKPFSAGDYMM